MVPACVLGTVYITEAHGKGNPDDYIEIYNAGDTDCSLLGFQLDDEQPFGDFTFGDVIIPAGGYWLGYEDAEGSFSSGIGGGGDNLYLGDTLGNVLMVESLDGDLGATNFTSDGTGCSAEPTPGLTNVACTVFIEGCTDETATNYNPEANLDTGCEYPVIVPSCVLGVVYITEAHGKGDPEDYIEIYNAGDTDCSLLGFQLDDEQPFGDFTFGDVIIPAGAYWVGEEDAEGSFSSGIGGGGDNLYLGDTLGNVLMVESLDGDLGATNFTSDGTGCSAEPTPGLTNVACTVFIEGCTDEAASNYNPEANLDTGCEYPVIVPSCVLGAVYITEAHGSGDPEDYIEIYNAGDTDCSMLGFQLDDEQPFSDFTFGDVIIPTGDYWLGYEDAEGSFSSGIGSGGDNLYLGDTLGNILMVSTYSGTYGATNFSADGTGCSAEPTPGAANLECTIFEKGCLDPNAANYNPGAIEQGYDQWNNTLCTFESCNDVPYQGCRYPEAFAGWHDGFGASECINYGGTPCEINPCDDCAFNEKCVDGNCEAIIPISTDLPVVYINTENQTTIKSKTEGYVNGHVTVVAGTSIKSGAAIQGLDSLVMEIRGRGNSTWHFHEKKPYQMKLADKAEFLDMPNDKKWLFIAEHSDKSMLRNTMAFEMGYASSLDWTPAGEFAEVYINGSYNGTYNITQKVEEKTNRVNIGSEGFLMEIDQIERIDEDDHYFATNEFPVINIKEPDINDIIEDDGIEKADSAVSKISDFINEFENTLFGDNFTDTETGYAKYIDVESFIDWFLISEILKNVDSRSFSSIYFNVVFDENNQGKVKMGPLWDFDLSFGNTDYADSQYPEGWWVRNNPWIARLCQDPKFEEQVIARFEEHFYARKGIILDKIDSYSSALAASAVENDNRWAPYIGSYAWPNPYVGDLATGNSGIEGYQDAVDNIANWYNTRMEWLKENFSSVEGCIDANAVNFKSNATTQTYDQWGNSTCIYDSCNDIPDAEGCSYANAYSPFNEGFNAANCVTYGGTACVDDTNITSVDVTFQVDMSAVDTHEEGVYLAGGDLGQEGYLMDHNGNDLWSITITLEPNRTYIYKFRNQPSYGTWDGFEAQDGLVAGGCSTGDWDDRFVEVAESDIVLDLVSYGSCTADGLVDISGCLDSNATNYNVAATDQAEDQWGNILCVYASCDDIPELGCIYAESFGAFHESFDGAACSNYGGTPCEGGSADVEGCVDANASNYDATATVQTYDQYGNSTCIYASCDDIPDAEGCSYASAYSPFHNDFTPENCETYGGTACTSSDDVVGCMDSDASNYDPSATDQKYDQWNNTVCTYSSCEKVPSEGCMYAEAFAGWHEGFGPNECITYGGTACTTNIDVLGCIDANASNYNNAANVQSYDQYNNSTCFYASCDDIPDDEGCSYGDAYAPFRNDFTPENCVTYGGTACTGISEVLGCIDEKATNYNSAANTQSEDQYGNILCIYNSCADIPEPGCIYNSSFGAFHDSFGASACSGYGGFPCGDNAVVTEVEVTFKVDMSNEEAHPEGVFLAGGDLGQSGYLMENQGSDIWTVTIILEPNRTYMYKFRNQPSYGTWDGFESGQGLADGGCSTGDWDDRFVEVAESNIVLDMVTYGSCFDEIANDVLGCIDVNASNYNNAANMQSYDQHNNSTCIYASCDDIPDDEGCSYGDAYTPFRDDFTPENCETYGGTACTSSDDVVGCMDSDASNYDPSATDQKYDQWNNTVCTYSSCEKVPSEGCMYAEAFAGWHEGFGPNECITYGGTPCEEMTSDIEGCLDSNATNYNNAANIQAVDQYGNLLCVYASCNDVPSDGCNYGNSFAPWNQWFGASECVGYGGTPCEDEVSGCTDNTAINYNSNATSDDNSCEYASCSPNWDVVLTDQNHSIFITGEWKDLNGNLMTEGSAIGVFYEDDNGNLKSAGWTDFKEGTVQIAAMGDDESTENTDGLISNQKLEYRIWDPTTCEEYPAAVTYSEGPETYVMNGISFINSVSAILPGPSEQELNLVKGWSIISTYMIPENTNFAEVISPIVENIIIAKNYSGAAYLPEYNFNGIGDVLVGQGYQLKTTTACDLTISGAYAFPEQNPINYVQGWNMIGYLRTESASCDLVLADMIDNLIIAKNSTGLAYLPEWNFNGIGHMKPGEGYQIKTTESGNLHYLSNDVSYRISSLEVIESNLSHFAKAPVTGNNMTVVIEDAAWDVLPEEGAELAAFDHAGHMIGSASYSSPVTALAVWGDDATTSTKDGLEVSEAVSFKVWTSDEVREFTVKEWTEGSSSYHVDAINVASSIETYNTITEMNATVKELLKVVNVLGQEVSLNDDSFKGKVLFNIYNDGTVEKVVK